MNDFTQISRHVINSGHHTETQKNDSVIMII